MRAHRRSLCLDKKIKTSVVLLSILRKLRVEGKKIVFTNGCFDILHYGHVKYLQDARNKGDILIVGLNRDISVRRIKGKDRPINNELDRAGVLAGLESVDFIVFFSEDNPLKLIRLLKPDLLIKGADWKDKEIIGANEVYGYGGKVETIPLAYGRSTSNLIKKIVRLYKR